MERSRGDFVGEIGVVGGTYVSSAQLKHFETRGSEIFGLKIGGFSIFWRFFVNPAVLECVSRMETVVVDASDSLGACDSKTSRGNALFSCIVLVLLPGDWDELAVVEMVGGCKIASLGVGGLK